MGNTKGLSALLTTPSKEEIETKEKTARNSRKSTSDKSETRRTSSKNNQKEKAASYIKSYRSFYISDDTSRLFDRVVNSIKVENSKYTNDDAMNEALKLLAKSNGVKI